MTDNSKYQFYIKKDTDLSDMIGPALVMDAFVKWHEHLLLRRHEYRNRSVEAIDWPSIGRIDGTLMVVDEAINALGEFMLKHVNYEQGKKVDGERHWKVKIEQLNTSIHYFNVQADSKREAKDKAYEKLSSLLGRRCDGHGLEFRTVLCEEVE